LRTAGSIENAPHHTIEIKENGMEEEKEVKKKGLEDYGIIYLSGEIGQTSAETVCKNIIEFNIKQQVNQIQLIINSQGGLCSAGFSIIDMMEWSKIPIYTTGIGMIASMGLLIFMTGAKGHRVITPRTSILSHRFYGRKDGNHSSLIASRKEEDLEHLRIVQHYLSYSNINAQKELEHYLLRDVDTWLNPQEAVEYGLADIIETLKNNHC
jgi:ATP-dependent Clp protease protease subunit